MAGHSMSSVHTMTISLQGLLEKALCDRVKQGIDHPVAPSDLDRLVQEIDGLPLTSRSQQTEEEPSRQTLFARIETAVRNVFNSLLASTSIDDPAFTKMWILLDVVSVLSDQERCEPGLIFWLVEELLDSQTIEGCKRVFDYLESRRERITAKHFKQKNLIILRSCNELLRRLSRAENTVFCGRVFIFLFQSFPLGDKSSVNLRGEYHVENTTSFENVTPKSHGGEDKMNTEREPNEPGIPASTEAEIQVQITGPTAEDGRTLAPVTFSQGHVENTNGTPNGEKSAKQSSEPDYDSLYPVFWSLQEHFSNPTSLFDSANLEKFKGGLAQTMNSFKEVQKGADNRGPTKILEENKRGVKRKRGEGPDYMASNFHPKYLTSRDLFELEISDLAFRRHIFVQALILVDFLLSLTPKAKTKLADLNTPNKSVQYQYTLSEENAKWATDVKSEIASYLQQGPEGKFYYRMVDTVLSRDKNWVRWKAESCPPIERPPVAAQEWLGARASAEKACIVRKLRSVPLGSLDLGFLSETDNVQGMEQLKDPRRYALPEVESFQASILDDDDNIQEALTEEAKEVAIDAKASKMWRVLRLAAKRRLTMFDKLENFVQDLRPVYRQDRENDPSDDSNIRDSSGSRTDGSSLENDGQAVGLRSDASVGESQVVGASTLAGETQVN